MTTFIPQANGGNGTSGTPVADHTRRPRVLVPEKVSQDGLALLRKTLDVDEKKGLSPEELQGVIGDYEALIVRSETKVTAELLAKGRRLKVVARAGVGVDNVDVTAATKLGIIVVNSPSGNIGAAAEHTIALMLSMARNIPDACASLKSGKWERSRLVGVEVKGKTLGIIGLGKVARCAIGLGMRVEALDPYASPAIAQAAHVTMVSSLPELLENCDFLTIHTPLIASTKGMIAASELNSMKKGARILNVARGGMIDEDALLTALESGQIAGAGIDVFTSEPPTADSSAARLIAHPKVVATPHLGASTVEAQENVSIDVCEQVIAILSGDLPRSAVNAPLILPEEYQTLQPFVKLVEKMGSLYTQHYSAPAKAARKGGATQATEPRTTFDLVYEGALATLSNTKPLYAALVKGLMAPISAAQVNIVNAELVARERGIIINEQKSRDPPEHSYTALVTLRPRVSPPSRGTSPYAQRSTAASAPQPPRNAPNTPQDAEADQQISGHVSAGQPVISRLGRFSASFAPEGNLLICHNYDAPGKIGAVGGILGAEGVNINFMTVAPSSLNTAGAGSGSEALMILGVDREASPDVVARLTAEQGILGVSAVAL